MMNSLNLPDLSLAVESTELSWSYTYPMQDYLHDLLRASSYNHKAHKAIERDIEDRAAMTQEKYGWMVTNLTAARLDRVSHMGDMSSAKEINRFLLRKVNS